MRELHDGVNYASKYGIMMILRQLVAVQKIGYHLVYLTFSLVTLRPLGLVSVGLGTVIMTLINLIISACAGSG